MLGLALLAAIGLGAALPAQTGRPVVYVVPITGVIDLGLAPFVSRVLEEAAEAQATAVILDINTFRGRVDAAVLIRDALLQARVRMVAFVNKRAISAGALISLAAETIAMADGGTIGAATPVEIGSPGGPARPVAEKTVSYMRKEFRATADIADVDVGEDIGAKLQIDQAKAEERRAIAVALEQEMRARVVEAESEVPRAMATAFREGNLGIMDYYRMKNVQADTVMREAIAGGEAEPSASPPPGRSR
jgi:membrane-bound serine protease (ClpP class)